jgi:hypothetical protein
MIRHISNALFVVAVTAPTASTQTPPPQDPGAGPLVIEKIESGFIISPDAKVAEINERVATFGGVTGGWISDRRVMIGGGGYWLANRNDTFKMAYGGPVVEWLVRGDKRIGFGVRGLVGGGTATLGTSVTALVGEAIDDIAHLDRMPLPRGVRDLVQLVTVREIRLGRTGLADVEIPIEQNYFIGEPQLNVFWNVTRRLRISGGASYRLIGGAHLLHDELEGISGNISLQISGW